MPLTPGERGRQLSTSKPTRSTGTIRLDGAYHGVTRLVDKRTGRQVIDCAVLGPESVQAAIGESLHGSAATDVADDQSLAHGGRSHLGRRPNSIWARSSPATRCAAKAPSTSPSAFAWTGPIRAMKLFMSSYFDKVMRPHVYVKALRPGAAAGRDRADASTTPFAGRCWFFLATPMRPSAASMGGGSARKGTVPFVQMVPVRRYAHPLSFMVDPEGKLAAVMMSRPSDCYAFSSRYFAENEADRPTPYTRLRSFAVRPGRGGGGRANCPRAPGADAAG